MTPSIEHVRLLAQTEQWHEAWIADAMIDLYFSNIDITDLEIEDVEVLCIILGGDWS